MAPDSPAARPHITGLGANVGVPRAVGSQLKMKIMIRGTTTATMK